MNIPKTEVKRVSRKQKAQLRRQQIIDAALKVFAEKGYDKASVKDISEAAGTSQGLMYHYFRSKEELLANVIESHSFIAQLRHIISSKHDKPIRQVLSEIAIAFYNLLVSNGEFTSIVIGEMQTNPVFKEKWATISMKGISLLSNYLQSHISAGNLKPHNTEVAARSMLYTIVMLFISTNAFSWSKLTVGEYIEETVDIFLNGIAAQSSDG